MKDQRSKIYLILFKFSVPLFFMAGTPLCADPICSKVLTRVGIFNLKDTVSKTSTVTWGEYLEIKKSQEHYLSSQVVEGPMKDSGWKTTYRQQGLSLGGLNGDFAEIQSSSLHEKTIFFGDAQGHSLTSAANSHFLHSFLASGEGKKTAALKDLSGILTHLDQNVPHFQLEKNFIALSVATLNTVTGEFKYSNAAMPGLYIIGKTGDVRKVIPGGPVLGAQLFEPIHDEVQSGRLASGETLIFVSDGLTDAPGISGWDFDVFLSNKYAEAKQDTKKMVELMLRDHPIHYDDRSVLAIKRPG